MVIENRFRLTDSVEIRHLRCYLFPSTILSGGKLCCGCFGSFHIKYCNGQPGDGKRITIHGNVFLNCFLLITVGRKHSELEQRKRWIAGRLPKCTHLFTRSSTRSLLHLFPALVPFQPLAKFYSAFNVSAKCQTSGV